MPRSKTSSDEVATPKPYRRKPSHTNRPRPTAFRPSGAVIASHLKLDDEATDVSAVPSPRSAVSISPGPPPAGPTAPWRFPAPPEGEVRRAPWTSEELQAILETLTEGVFSAEHATKNAVEVSPILAISFPLRSWRQIHGKLSSVVQKYRAQVRLTPTDEVPAELPNETAERLAADMGLPSYLIRRFYAIYRVTWNLVGDKPASTAPQLVFQLPVSSPSHPPTPLPGLSNVLWHRGERPPSPRPAQPPASVSSTRPTPMSPRVSDHHSGTLPRSASPDVAAPPPRAHHLYYRSSTPRGTPSAAENNPEHRMKWLPETPLNGGSTTQQDPNSATALAHLPVSPTYQPAAHVEWYSPAPPPHHHRPYHRPETHVRVNSGTYPPDPETSPHLPPPPEPLGREEYYRRKLALKRTQYDRIYRLMVWEAETRIQLLREGKPSDPPRPPSQYI
ncbi:hypothetical protein IWQ60_011535 [Tieghemiomyces parasiticus]|uniref:Uncharacterized protein n=1 Tax=Tieghemiomyces parasiticus TaxID=78921 RepID=A0A9W8DH71_9FUNG|nr:hypothetical protein IWQ60_011535 [Tieghemiomyces parasiticus]